MPELETKMGLIEISTEGETRVTSFNGSRYVAKVLQKEIRKYLENEGYDNITFEESPIFKDLENSTSIPTYP